MGLTRLAIRDFRNIASADLQLSPRLNLITGANAAGKTSLLEAVYFLGRAQSFRTTHPTSLIREGAESLVVRGEILDEGQAPIPVGVQRDRAGIKVRLAAKPVRQLTELVAHFPIQLLTPDSHQLIEGGPRFRRRFLDWGVFHVEPAFFPLWQRYNRALKQRNAALKARLPANEIVLWDEELVDAAESIDRLRRAYLDELIPQLAHCAGQLVNLSGLAWDYRPGWTRRLGYAAALAEALEGDRRQGFTRSGPHRADLVPTLEGVPIQERVSRGQQKQVVAALMLAQARLFQIRRDRPCLFLVDDLASELDAGHRQRVLGQLESMGGQVFVTAIDPASLDAGNWPEARRFHVEHGRVEEVIY